MRPTVYREMRPNAYVTLKYLSVKFYSMTKDLINGPLIVILNLLDEILKVLFFIVTFSLIFPLLSLY